MLQYPQELFRTLSIIGQPLIKNRTSTTIRLTFCDGAWFAFLGLLMTKELQINDLFPKIRQILEQAKARAYKAVNSAMVMAYWNVGKLIVEEEQKGQIRADYGELLIKALSARLTVEYGKGFTVTNLKYFRQFYITFPIGHALRDQLTWTHYRLLLKVEKPDVRNFYIYK